LKYIVGFYFDSEKLKTDQISLSKKRKWTQAIMWIWIALVLIYCSFDFGFNYFDYYIFHNNEKQIAREESESGKAIDLPPTDFMRYTYCIVASQFVVLTLLIIWHTISLNKII